jgi:hypothetical protein
MSNGKGIKPANQLEEALKRLDTLAKIIECPICQDSIAVVGYGRACIAGHLVCKDCSAERPVTATQGDEDVQELAPPQAANQTERLSDCPLCRDKITDPIEHLLADQVSELVWFDCNLKCGVKLTVEDIKSGKHPMVCGNRQVRCPITQCGKHTRGDMALFKAVDVAAMINAEHVEVPVFTTNVLTINCVIGNGGDCPMVVPTSSWVANLIGDDGMPYLLEAALDRGMGTMMASVLALDDDAEYQKAKVTIGDSERPVVVAKLSYGNLRDMGAVQGVPMNNRIGGFSFLQEMVKKIDDQTWAIPVTARLVKEEQDESAASTHRIEVTVQAYKRNQRNRESAASSSSSSRKRRHEPSDSDETTMGSQQ